MKVGLQALWGLSKILEIVKDMPEIKVVREGIIHRTRCIGSDPPEA